MSKQILFSVTRKGYMNDTLLREGDTFMGDESTPKATWYERADGKPTKPKAKTEADGVGLEELDALDNESLDGNRSEELKAVFETLDPADGSQWTTSGLPNLKKLNALHEGDNFVKTDLTSEMTRDNLMDKLTGG